MNIEYILLELSDDGVSDGSLHPSLSPSFPPGGLCWSSITHNKNIRNNIYTISGSKMIIVPDKLVFKKYLST
jgi:hypothetical protein